MTTEQKLQAIAARLSGIYDDAQLLKIGALNGSRIDDIQRILNIPTTEPVKTFPNGFRSWMETFFEVVTIMTLKNDISPVIQKAREIEGTPGAWDIAEKITDDFELLNAGREWNGEFYEEVEEFIKSKLS